MSKEHLFYLLICPIAAWAGDEDLQSFKLSYSQYDETLALEAIETEVSPASLLASYTYISAEGLVWSGDIWHEEAKESIKANAKLEKGAWGGGLSLAYSLGDLEVEWLYSYSRSDLKAWSGAENRIEEDSESFEYGVRTLVYYSWDEWSMSPSVLLAYQDTRSQIKAWLNKIVISEKSSETAWLVSPALSLSYMFELNDRATLSPNLALSWNDAFHGEGRVRTLAYRRSASLSEEGESELGLDGSGRLSLGASLSVDSYYLDLSLDEMINLPNIGTQINLGLGMVW